MEELRSQLEQTCSTPLWFRYLYEVARVVWSLHSTVILF